MKDIKDLENFLMQQQLYYGFRFSVVPIPVIHKLLEEKPQDALAILSTKEQSMFHSFINYKKKLEWLSGRTAAKKAILSLWGQNNPGIEEYKNCQLFYGKQGEPYIPASPQTHISISHSQGIAIALASFSPIGIDLEKNFLPEKSLLRFFFAPQEENQVLSLCGEEQKRQAALLWTKKEAIAKLLKLGGSLFFQEICVLENNVYVWNRSFSLISFSTEEYAITLALEKKRMTYQEIYEKTRYLIQDYLRLETEEILPKSHLMMDFNADSIAIVEIGFRIAETFHIPIPPPQDSLLIFENTVAYIQEELQKQNTN
ncbi:MAG: 4'-phosphopantetheinyl transferase superfamily protein [Candidatus Brocadiae bacterium]|nr:4'-phosphopantetheinyl transferase superfamily protein [Candidatus Brocadiia bacterium]